MSYRDLECPNCGRNRVELDGVCEKCYWDVDGGDYVTITRPNEWESGPNGFRLQSDLREARFIGGSKDGKIIKVAWQSSTVVFPVLDEPMVVGIVGSDSLEATFHNEVYDRLDQDTFALRKTGEKGGGK